MDVDDYEEVNKLNQVEEEEYDPAAPKPILRLEETVVNRIAAGEIIQRPANALKELIENCLDAGATVIKITVKDGGMKLLQIQDNGSGIRHDDLPILCERFTTSKLREFSDLSSMSTFGFRGEALASISHVAHVAVLTKTKDSNCAWKAHYSDGELVPAKPGGSKEPTAAAGNQGTVISAEDLFFNVPTRRRALKSASEEYSRILDVVTRYAVHNPAVSFVCKKSGSSSAEVTTPSSAAVPDAIKILYGASIAKELVHLPPKRDDILNYSVEGWFTSANWNSKRMQFLLFINHRLVESQNLKRAIEALYTTYLPKGTSPWVYISLSIDPHCVDVNVHPTKKEVHFLNETEIVQSVVDTMQEVLAGANSSRVFTFQTLLPGASDPEAEYPAPPRKSSKVWVKNGSAFDEVMGADEDAVDEDVMGPAVARVPPKPLPSRMIRSDPKVRTLDSMFPVINPQQVRPKTSGSTPFLSSPSISKKVDKKGKGREVDDDDVEVIDVDMGTAGPAVIPDQDEEMEDDDYQDQPKTHKKHTHNRIHNHHLHHPDTDDDQEDEDVAEVIDKSSTRVDLSDSEDVSVAGESKSQPSTKKREYQVLTDSDDDEEEEEAEVVKSITQSDCVLSSVKQLRDEIKKEQHNGLSLILQEHTFVGIVDLATSTSLIQYKTKLYLVNHGTISEDLFYQLGVKQFGQIPRVKLDPPPSLLRLLTMAVNREADRGVLEKQGVQKEGLAQKIFDIIMERREMLEEYFSLEISEEGAVEFLPLLLPGYLPNVERLPMFLMRLGPAVDWQEEKSCFQTFFRELAYFYIPGSFDGDIYPSQLPSDDSSPTEEEKATEKHSRWQVQHVLFPAMRKHLVPSKELAKSGDVTQVADLPDLFKIFERC